MGTGHERTILQTLEHELGIEQGREHEPNWRLQQDRDGFCWILDGERAVALVDCVKQRFELRCAAPDSPPSPPILPQHYHIPTLTGVRLMFNWYSMRSLYDGIPPVDLKVQDDGVTVNSHHRLTDGSRAVVDGRVTYDTASGSYVFECDARLDARRSDKVEVCNVLPAGIGDTRPGKERFAYTFWLHPDGLVRMGKNPLWWTSVGAQDIGGTRRIANGGFIGFGSHPDFNPVVEVIESSPAAGAATCCCLQDEHLMLNPAQGVHASTGWFQYRIRYRVFSIDQRLADDLIKRSTDLDPGPMLAWKFQYPPLNEIPADLNGVELPGSPFIGASDWSQPIPWDQPFDGVLWTASPDPAAPIHYDQSTGHERPGAIRLRVEDERCEFAPGSGHTIHTEAGKTYTFSMWIRTEGNVEGWIEGAEMLFRRGTCPVHVSERVPPDTGWTYVETSYVAQGDDAPFFLPVLHAEGSGQVWFADMRFETVHGGK